jgi:hypothetical protein
MAGRIELRCGYEGTHFRTSGAYYVAARTRKTNGQSRILDVQQEFP